MTQPVDGGFLLFIYLLVPYVLFFLNAWFPATFHRIQKRTETVFSFLRQWIFLLKSLYVSSLLIGVLLFIPYGLEAGVWRMDGCPYFFSNRSCVDWYFEIKTNAPGYSPRYR